MAKWRCRLCGKKKGAGSMDFMGWDGDGNPICVACLHELGSSGKPRRAVLGQGPKTPARRFT